MLLFFARTMLRLTFMLCLVWTESACEYFQDMYNNSVQAPVKSKTLEMTTMNFLSIPGDILRDHPDVTALQLPYNKIRYIGNDDFPKESCKEIRYINLNGNFITHIEEDAFSHMPWLLEIDLSNNQLTEVPKIKAPRLRKIHMDKNQIVTISAEAMKHYKKLEHLELGFNKIEEIETNTFSENKELYWLVLKENPLRRIDENAFKGADSLNTLLLQNTFISQLPSRYGISSLETLNIMNTPNLFTIPDPVKFKKLKSVFVTYSMHCCAFKMERELPKLNNTKPCPTDRTNLVNPGEIKEKPNSTDGAFGNLFGDLFGEIFEAFNSKPENYSLCSGLGELVGGRPLDTHIKIECTPEPDAFNPCQDVMGSDELRGFSWLIAICAIIGNVFQLIILFHSRHEFTVYKLLMYNLGFSNLLMGIYLLVLCCVDAYTYGKYYNYVQSWQFKGGCQAFGFIALFATSLSVCSLMLITLERYLLIIYALSIGNQMKLRHAKFGVLVSWLYSFLVAGLPVANTVNSYSKTAICLPMDTATAISEGYLVWLLLVYLIAFVVIVLCYVRMYKSINEVRPGIASTDKIEIKVAKRMSLIIFSNFLCWLPISIVGLIAMYSGVRFDVKVAKFLIVFIFPLNACTNPFLYAIFTKVFRADTLDLLSACGIYKRNDPGAHHKSSKYNLKKRSETNVSHMHIQSPATHAFSSRPIRDTPMNVVVDSPHCSSDCSPDEPTAGAPLGINNKSFKQLNKKTSVKDQKELRFRSESNETASTGFSHNDDDDNSKLGISIQEASVLLP